MELAPWDSDGGGAYLTGAIAKMSQKQLTTWLNFCIDGVVLSLPPTNATDRSNFVSQGDTHMFRKKTEVNDPALAGKLVYAKQVDLDHAVPLWAGVGPKGFAGICFHPTKKLQVEEWVGCVQNHTLKRAIASVNVRRGAKKGWRMLSDNEGFLGCPDSRSALRKEMITLLQIPAKSPDLNPIEKFWSWLRKQLRDLDSEDLRAGKPVPSRASFERRVLKICASERGMQVAKSCFLGLPKVCAEVVANKGAMAKS